MVKNEIIVRALATGVAVLAALSVSAQDYRQDYRVEWTRTRMDGSRTGVEFASASNVKEAMGEVKGRKYYAPNGKVYKKGVTRKVAKTLLDVQPEMAEVKQVVAYSPREMVKHAPESELSNWFVDLLISQCEKFTGNKVDVGFANFGGIRVDMPKGDVLLDDIMSMFPFRNKLVYLELKGSDLRVILEQMARNRWQVVGGVRCKSTRDGRLISAEIGGEPLDDDRIYGVTTIDFLLGGGDGYSIGKNAVKTEILDKYIIDVVLPYVKELTAEGKPLEYHTDGRIQIVD